MRLTAATVSLFLVPIAVACGSTPRKFGVADGGIGGVAELGGTSAGRGGTFPQGGSNAGAGRADLGGDTAAAAAGEADGDSASGGQGGLDGAVMAGTGGRLHTAGSGGNSPAGGAGGNSPAGGAGGKSPAGGAGGKSPAGGAGGNAPAGGSGGTGGGSAGSAGSSTSVSLPCDVLKNGGSQCVAAHSTVRVIVPSYTGPLYQLCNGTAAAGPASCKGTAQDVGSKEGYADAAAHDAFCSGAACTITKIYDQSGQKNDLEPAPKGGAKPTPDNPADAGALKVTINGHAAYGILIKGGIGYRAGCSGCTVKTGNGMVKGDDPESMYWVTSQKDLIDNCCFDYGNAEVTSNDDGNGTMEALYFGGGVVWGTGAGGKPGPWIMADLENGLYAGWENKQDKNISTNTALNYDFVTGVLLGDTQEKNSGKGRFALYGGDSTSCTLKVMYDGIRPEKPGYVPMLKQGSIILGLAGDNSNSAGGRFYEGAISVGPVLTKQSVDALQAAIVGAKYGK